MKYAQHWEKLKKEMEKSQRTVKVLDMPIEDSIIGGEIENSQGKSKKKTLKNKLNVSLEHLISSSITINTKLIRNGNTPVGIIAPIKIKKSRLRKLSELPLKR